MLLNDLSSLSPWHHAASDNLLLLGVVHEAVAAVLVWLAIQAERLYVVELLHDVDGLLLIVEVANDIGNLWHVLLVALIDGIDFVDRLRDLNLLALI